MNETLAIQTIQAFHATVRLPGSKSLTNRALLLGALAEGPTRLTGALVADDTRVMVGALRALGFDLTVGSDGTEIVIENGGATRTGLEEATPVELDLGNAGTAYRFLTAACCLWRGGVYRLDGVPRMRQRPIGQLVDLLRQIGGEIRYLGEEGYPPIEVRGTGLAGGELEVGATLSSQYITALLQVGPYCEQGLTLRFKDKVISEPYVRMTVALMERFGAKVEVGPGFSWVRMKPGRYVGTDYDVEPDASAASYFLAAAAIVPGSQCTVEGLGRGSLQGDVGFADVLHEMGAGLVYGRDFITVMAPKEGGLRGVDVDLNAMPDMAQTLAVVALFAKGPTVIRNIGNLRVKETDRLAALKNELTKLDATVVIDGDDLRVEPPADPTRGPAAGTVLETYEDHRMAMSLAVAGLRMGGVVIGDPGCVRKTFPEYFTYLSGLGRSGGAGDGGTGG